MGKEREGREKRIEEGQGGRLSFLRRACSASRLGMTARGLVWVAALTVGCASAGGAPGTAPRAAVAAKSVAPTADELRRDLVVFASDSFRGRETGTADERRAAAFLVARLTALGLQPAGDSGFYQRVPLVRQVLGPGSRFAVTTAHGTTTMSVGGDLLPLIDVEGGVPPKRHADGALVFAGYGIARSAGHDDLDDVPVRGKVVVLVNGAPRGVSPGRRGELEGEAAVGARLARLLPRHPAAVIVLLTGQSATVYPRLAAELRRSLSLAGPSAEVLPDGQRPVPMILIGRPVAGSPLLPKGWPGDDRPQVLAGRRFTGRVELVREPVTSYNVAAIVPGRDPALSTTYVAFGAHYDHIGIQPAEHGDSIANGADDDGSGSVALLALARAMGDRPAPRRSVLFIWHVGEEKGLLGSAYFTDHPTVPIDSIVAQVNADMIGRNSPDSLYVVGPAAAPHGQSRALGVVVDSINATLDPPFVFNREWDSPTHPEQIYYRSDHYNYARKGVPIVFFTSGLHADYHRVTDDAAKIDYDKLARVDGLLLALGEALANRETRPR